MEALCDLWRRFSVAVCKICLCLFLPLTQYITHSLSSHPLLCSLVGSLVSHVIKRASSIKRTPPSVKVTCGPDRTPLRAHPACPCCSAAGSCWSRWRTCSRFPQSRSRLRDLDRGGGGAKEKRGDKVKWLAFTRRKQVADGCASESECVCVCVCSTLVSENTTAEL